MLNFNIVYDFFKGFIINSEFTPSDDLDDDETKVFCSKNLGEDDGPKVMINVIKINDDHKEDLDKYQNAVVFNFFARIGSFMFDVGSVESDYWSTVSKRVFKHLN